MDEYENVAGRHRFGGSSRCSPVPSGVVHALCALAALVVAFAAWCAS